MKELALVFVGGGLGSMVRFYLSRWVSTVYASSFPWGTLASNVVACLCLGLVIGLADARQVITPGTRLFWTAGFCGGFSTFSTFSYDSLILFQNGLTFHSATYIAASLAFCLAATFGGLYIGAHL